MSETKKQQRIDFRLLVLGRDGNRCRVCGTERAEARLDVHHITPREQFAHGGYVAPNGIVLCKYGEAGERSCHEKAELAIATLILGCPVIDPAHELWRYAPAQLYALIGSSIERARESDERSANAPRSQRYVRRPEQKPKKWHTRRYG